MLVKELIANDKKVAKILSCFELNIVVEWMSTDWEHLIEKTFTEFMKEFCTYWLPNNWEQMVLTQMLAQILIWPK